MSVRVVARIRPLLKAEREQDIIVEAASSTKDGCENSKSVVKIPNPKNVSEDYSFQFSNVYDAQSRQEDIFQNEVAPTLKSLFQGLDVTLFAYGVTGTGKTHTMRGGKSLAERGVIPRLLSGIYRRSRKMEKDSNGTSSVEVSMSYYEIYNDRVFDLFEPPEKRTPTGLPLRDHNGKTIVVGLSERPCATLKEFEHLYDQANVNRSTSATKLNAHSSRSHAILRVKLTVTTGEETRVSTASAIDLAGSEDNRRTENGKERMVESASINKSLFVLAQCVEAISRKSSRIPYRESKMTRILSLGQNNGITIMILNLAPIKSFHLDTLSSLNFANRTKTIQVKEIENEPLFKGQARPSAASQGQSVQRQPLKPLASSVANSRNVTNPPKPGTKPLKAFCVYADKSHGAPDNRQAHPRSGDLKRPLEPSARSTGDRALKSPRVGYGQKDQEKAIGEMVERKVEEILAARALNESSKPVVDDISEQVQKRLEMLEQKIEKKQDARAEGLTYLLMAKQHHVRGEELSALKMYQLALPFFPNNERLVSKMQALEAKLQAKREGLSPIDPSSLTTIPQPQHEEKLHGEHEPSRAKSSKRTPEDDDDDYHDQDYAEPPATEETDGDFAYRRSQQPRKPVPKPRNRLAVFRDLSQNNTDTRRTPDTVDEEPEPPQTPRTRHLLHIINTGDLAQLKALKGVGVKKAELILDSLAHPDLLGDGDGDGGDDEEIEGLKEAAGRITSLRQLGAMRGVGLKTVENMRAGMVL
ncbi:MAG: T-complex protein 1 subunit zeta [Chaenotheca gracillima]|nr:MAG: T-complex protein 1 subunit zeta [Chaenotheca gracillima]